MKFVLMFLACMVVGRRVRPTPVEVYLSEQRKRIVDYKLEEDDQARLKMLVLLPGSLESALKGEVLFNTHFLEVYKVDPMLIVNNYVRQVEMEVLGVFRDVVSFFYDESEELVNIGPIFFKEEWSENQVQQGIQEIFEYWIKLTPGSTSNTNPLLAHLYNGPLGVEIDEIINLLGSLIRSKHKNHLGAIRRAVEWTKSKYDAFPEPLYSSIRKLRPRRPVKITDSPHNEYSP
ncbi:hypothetical protein DSO57_1002445 [Entomophthora muscae]|uniref:Uncharacterized protein n=1 Tax=Entomophthora muscae TaxID=34485 RepID=A0ACC2RZP3_9FUNG|nr:hypothetical protein DSO57_1002445 [Entomophthora muscae]